MFTHMRDELAHLQRSTLCPLISSPWADGGVAWRWPDNVMQLAEGLSDRQAATPCAAALTGNIP